MFKTMLAVTLISTQVWADFKLDGLSRTNVEDLTKEFSTNFFFSSVTPASSLKKKWDFEVGLIAGITKTPELKQLIRSQDATQDVGEIPHAQLLFALTMPHNLTAELGITPKVSVDNGDLSVYSGAAKWTFTNLMDEQDRKVEAALRAHVSVGELSYTQVVNNTSTGNSAINANIEMDDVIFGLDIHASKKFEMVKDGLVFEPYAISGLAHARNEITAMGVSSNIALTIFDSSSYGANVPTAEESITSFRAGVGAQLDFGKFHLASEYNNVYGTSRVSAKLSFAF